MRQTCQMLSVPETNRTASPSGQKYLDRPQFPRLGSPERGFLLRAAVLRRAIIPLLLGIGIVVPKAAKAKVQPKNHRGEHPSTSTKDQATN